MKIIKSSATIIPQESGIIGAYKQIEKVGRACWASENLITEDSYKNFVNGLVEREHNAPLEHGTIYLVYAVGSPMYDGSYMLNISDINKFKNNPYSKVVEKRYDIAAEAKNDNWIFEFVANFGPSTIYYVTTNLRVIIENFNRDNRQRVLDHIVNVPHKEHKLRITVHFTCQRAISAEFNRHRKNSIMERSSRYCNFSKDKFGNEIGIVKPDWVEDKGLTDFHEYISTLVDYSNTKWKKVDYWMFANLACEWSYMHLLDLGCKPEEARDILPMDLQTELYHTAFLEDWIHFFKLRAWQSKGNKPHPEAMKLARQVFDKFVELGYVSDKLRIDNEIAN